MVAVEISSVSASREAAALAAAATAAGGTPSSSRASIASCVARACLIGASGGRSIPPSGSRAKKDAKASFGAALPASTGAQDARVPPSAPRAASGLADSGAAASRSASARRAWGRETLSSCTRDQPCFDARACTRVTAARAHAGAAMIFVPPRARQRIRAAVSSSGHSLTPHNRRFFRAHSILRCLLQWMLRMEAQRRR